MAHIRINNVSPTFEANKERVLYSASDSPILTQYKPLSAMILTTQTPSILMCYVGTDGTVYGKSTQNGAISVTCSGTYPYQSISN